jgi:uncharacterized protein YkwD
MKPTGSDQRRIWIPIVVAVAIAAALAPAPSAVAAETRTAGEAAAEQDFLVRANGARSAAGLGSFAGSAAWQEHARNHSEEMARSGSIFHDTKLAAEAGTIGCWARVGENVGVGHSVDAIHSALMASPTHRSNILGDFDALGVGVETTAQGQIYVTQRFLKSCGGAPAVAQPPAPAPAPIIKPAPRPAVAALPSPAPASPRPVSKVSTAAAPAPPPLEPSRGVEQERSGGLLVFDRCFLSRRGVMCTSRGY